MEYRFPANEIHTIQSTRVATYTTQTAEVGDDIVVVVPDGVNCEAEVVAGVLNLTGDGGNATLSGDLNLQVGFVSGNVSGGALSQSVQIKVPPYKSNLNIRNSW
ncbi:MAG TPA: hypothetical protein VFH06_00580 [Candidatus Saccharimonadales bacterium]|nr:hypothetical protein [Candidatus Saccharimonadales bacterium]